MPERVEALVISECLHKKIAGKLLLSIDYTDKARQSGFKEVKLPLMISEVYSYGKKVIMKTSTERSEAKGNEGGIITSLGMTGCWSFTPMDNTHITFHMGRRIGRIGLLLQEFSLYYSDARRIGNVAIVDDVKSVLSDLGPDILDNIDTQTWMRIFRNPKISNWQVCKAIMDQNTIAGVGNYLKAEILYEAGIRPDRILKELNDKELERIRQYTYSVVQAVRKYNGLTISTYWSPDGQRGTYPKKVYKQNKDPMGNDVTTHKFKDGRTTYWVPSVQK